MDVHKDTTLESFLVEEAAVDSDIPSISIVILVTAQGVTEQLTFEIDLLSHALRRAMTIKDHKSFMRVHYKTFRCSQFMEWMTAHAAKNLFGSKASDPRHKTLTKAVAVMLGDKFLTVGILRQVTGSLSKPFEDANALLRFHEDEKHMTAVNCKSLWFQSARAPQVVITELLNTLLNIVRATANPGKELKGSEVLGGFTAATQELQMINTSDMSRVQLLTFFINVYNLMTLHLHCLRGTLEKADMKDLKLAFTREHFYMIAAYNYCLAEIEEVRFQVTGLARLQALVQARKAHLFHFDVCVCTAVCTAVHTHTHTHTHTRVRALDLACLCVCFAHAFSFHACILAGLARGDCVCVCVCKYT